MINFITTLIVISLPVGMALLGATAAGHLAPHLMGPAFWIDLGQFLLLLLPFGWLVRDIRRGPSRLPVPLAMIRVTLSCLLFLVLANLFGALLVLG